MGRIPPEVELSAHNYARASSLEPVLAQVSADVTKNAVAGVVTIGRAHERAYQRTFSPLGKPLIVDSSDTQQQLIEWRNMQEETSRQFLVRMAENPHEFIENFEGIMFCAGGALVLEFGDDNSDLWPEILACADEHGSVEIAGVTFEVDNLAMMGDFYRWLAQKGIILHCIDERLDEGKHTGSQIHCECGACGGIDKLLMSRFKKSQKTEERLAANKDYVPEDAEKQPLLPGMPHHASRAIHVSISDKTSAPKSSVRSLMKENDALTFNVSLPLGLMKDFCQETSNDYQTLVETLVKWNVQIAKNIIDGDHNDLGAHRAQTLLLLNQLDGQPDKELVDALGQVIPLERTLRIGFTN